MKITQAINNVKDPQARRALQLLFELVVTDQEANAATFAAHYHDGTTSSDTPLNVADDSAATFDTTLE